MQRRTFLATGATAALAPFINLGRVRVLAGQRAVRYSTRAVDLVGSATVVDMLAPFKIDIEGVDHPRRVFDLTEGLIRRGYSDADIRGVLGGNFRRVMAQIWS